MLHRRGAELLAYAFQNALAGVPVIAENAHLDELVSAQGSFDLAEHCLGNTALSYNNGRFQRVGAGFERTALCRRELHGHGNLLKQAF